MRILLFILIFSFLLYVFWAIKLLALKKWIPLIVLITVPFLAFCFSTFIFYINSSNYPDEWNNNLLNKKRKEVHHRLGKTKYDKLWDIKSDIWFDHHILSWHRLDVIYDKTDSTVGAYSIQYYVGAYGIFKNFNIKANNQP